MSGAGPERIRARGGRGIAVRGNDIDTDQIMPARFLKSTSFAGLEEKVFYDLRFTSEGEPRGHPFDRAEYAGAGILLVNENFGCGSSREHAPQGLKRWGIVAIVGESFSEIFSGNCVSIGVPAVTAAPANVARLMDAVERDPGLQIEVDLESMRVAAGDLSAPVEMPAGGRARLLEGRWDAMRLLLSAADDIHAIAARLPYVSGF
ncbi:MAG: 3-isopropylmalate dehydratase small subunit [Proteobacteria bacterium]|nr:3-isopropylmalate dehydratase small subunit [Pseudomonadota bacterium]